MLNRLRQVYFALTASITPSDHEFVRSLLTDKELIMFFGMDLVDQRHCIDVARTCLEILKQEPRPANLDLLLKAALLHDVGKQAGDLNLWKRIMVVLTRRFCPSLFHRLALNPRSPCHISLYHPQVGKEKCLLAGCPADLARLVGLHHSSREGVELEILSLADHRN